MNKLTDVSLKKQEKYELDARSCGAEIIDMPLYHHVKKKNDFAVTLVVVMFYLMFLAIGFILGISLVISIMPLG